MHDLNRIGVFIFYLLASTCANAQNVSVNDAQENIFKLGGINATSGVVRQFDNRYEGVEGSPFYMETWLSGSITFQNDEHIENIQLKYNVYEDELIINKSNAGQFYLPKTEIKSFTLQHGSPQQSYTFIRLQHPKKATQSQFYRIIHHGAINLLEYTRVVFEKADFEGGYSNNKRFDEFKKYPAFYYNSATSIPKKVKTNPKAISKLFPNKNGEIKKYIDENGLDCNNEEDLIKIFSYYDKNQ